jgi:hypothetical protein
MTAKPIQLINDRDLTRDRLHRFFELDSPLNFPHNENTSQPAQQLIPAKPMFACSLAAALQFPDLVALHRNLSPCRSTLRRSMLARLAP